MQPEARQGRWNAPDLLPAKLEKGYARIAAMWKFHRSLANNPSACDRGVKERGNTAQCPVVIEVARGDDQRRSGVKREKEEARNPIVSAKVTETVTRLTRGGLSANQAGADARRAALPKRSKNRS